jgi:hypothetical protein
VYFLSFFSGKYEVSMHRMTSYEENVVISALDRGQLKVPNAQPRGIVPISF